MTISANQTPTRKEAARIERTSARRQQVLAAASELMEETGYHGMSMQALADRADVSVGLIYQYFGGKEDVLQAVIVDILEDFAAQVPTAIADAGSDPVARLTSAVRAFCRVIDTKREATALAYRESQTLPLEARRRIMSLETSTSEPIRQAIRDGIDAGVFRPVDVELVAHNILMTAHGWSLKHWNLGRRMSVEGYADGQVDLLLASLRTAVPVTASPPPPRTSDDV